MMHCLLLNDDCAAFRSVLIGVKKCAAYPRSFHFRNELKKKLEWNRLIRVHPKNEVGGGDDDCAASAVEFCPHPFSLLGLFRRCSPSPASSVASSSCSAIVSMNDGDWTVCVVIVLSVDVPSCR